MTRVLRSAAKNIQIKEDLASKLSVSKKSKTIKRGRKKTLELEEQDNQRNDAWNINSILSNIFAYTDFKDLVKFNTVCKRWNNLTNPIIHKSIKLQRRRAIQNKFHDKRFNKRARADAEVGMCISDNSKYAPFIKEFKYTEKLDPKRAIDIFETFRFITNLTFEKITMSQDQFIAMVKPLSQLQELNLKYITVKKIIKHSFITEAVELPPTFTKLTMDYINTIRNCDLFVQTINSHKNLREFSYSNYNESGFLDPFKKNYPTLKIFDYHDDQLVSPNTLIEIFELNPQITTLKLKLSCWNSALMSSVARQLISLEEFSFTELTRYLRENSTLLLKFPQSTKIKKLHLEWDKLSSCSLESILKNCPELEELKLNLNRYYLSSDTDVSIKLSNPTKIKKLEINCTRLSDSSLNSILLSCPQLKELNIYLPLTWKEWINSIGSMCMNLEKLKICPSCKIYGQDRDIFYREINEIELLTSNSLYKSTLTHLTLDQFNLYDSKAIYFENFKNLKSIKFLAQSKIDEFNNNLEANFDLWPNYRLITKDNKYNVDVELIKLYSQ